jgi:hypothetical protein
MLPRCNLPQVATLLSRDNIELARGFSIEEGDALFLVASAPVFMPAGNAEEVTRADAFFASSVLIEIGTSDAE